VLHPTPLTTFKSRGGAGWYVRKRENLVSQLARSGRCALCKGSKMLCGKTSCPLLAKYYALLRARGRVSQEFAGSSPPSVFVGRHGYPKVRVGPMVPPEIGDTSIYDSPERWIDLRINDILNYRSVLVRGMKVARVEEARDPGRYLATLQEIAISRGPVDSDVALAKRPLERIVVDGESQPFGPSAPLRRFDPHNPKADPRLEKAYYDTDLRAAEAVHALYLNGVEVTRIQRAFSAGVFGVERRLVPTRWSITAVDSTIGERFLKDVRTYEPIDRYLIFRSDRFENRFLVIMMPGAWSYELVEAWYPGTIWNPYGRNEFLISDHEFYEGRSDYASIGGCYYAARMAVSEHLWRMGRQAEVVVLREAQPSYILPVGVWHVRENVRAALRDGPAEAETFEEVLAAISAFFHIPLKRWLSASALLRRRKFQRRITDYA